MKQIAVIGLGHFGGNLARALADEGAQVVAIDRNKDPVEELKDTATYAVTLNATDENALRSTNIQEVDAAVVCIGADVEANLLVTLLLKKLGIPRIWSRAISPLQQEILRTLDVDHIINLEQEMGQLVARSLMMENVIKHVPLSSGYSVAEIEAPASLVGKSLRQARLRSEYQLNVVALRRKKPQITREGERTFETYTENVPDPDEPLREQDILVMVGSDERIARFSES